MKAKIIALVIAFGLIAYPVTSYAKTDEPVYSKEFDDCIAKDSSTMGMDECANREWEQWDKRLNEIYKKKIAQYEQGIKDSKEGTDRQKEGASERLKAFKAWQREWIKYRDATCSVDYWRYYPGTISSNLESSCRLKMTAERAIELENIVVERG